MGGEGQRTVFVRYRDQAGNYSQAYSDSIQIDNRPPQINNVTVNQLSGDTVEIRWRTDEPTFGLVQYNADVRNYSLRSNDNHGDFQGNYGTDHVIRINRLQLGRVYYGRIDAVDRAGNHSQSPEFSFNIPVGPVATQQPQQPPQRPQQPPQSSGINVALKTNGVSTETFPKTGTPDAVIDGDNSTYWQFQIKPPEQGFLGIPLYWQVNFNQKYHLQKIKLTMETDTRFSIQYSRDGKWQLLKSVDKDFQNSNKFEFNLDIETNAIRIVWPWGHVKLYEVEVYN